MREDTERNRKTAIDFYTIAFAEKDPDRALQYVGDYYTQHNPSVPEGKEAFRAFAKQRAADNPGRTIEIRRTIAEGDYVVLHTHQTFAKTDKDYPNVPNGRVAVDIFRLENGKIVEHWDVIQTIPEKMAHGNTMY
jgi:predicted SnoaL-like aldol condensation-catalyzing enzyme